MKVEEVRHVTLCNLPTPLMEMPALSAKLGGPQIFIKRDDLTGLAMGGNKGRMLEVLMSEAKDMSADVVITAGGPQGNLGPQVAAAACKLGMDVIMLVVFKGGNTIQGNSLLLNLFGVEIITGIENYEQDKIYKQLDELAVELRSKGRRPYVIGFGKGPLALVGYAQAVSEICKQLKERGLTAQHLFVATSSGTTQAGLSLGIKYFNAPFRLVGVKTDKLLLTKQEQVRNITDRVNAAASFFEMNFTLKTDEVILHDEYIGRGYGTPTKESIEAVKLVAEAEGILLDPLYTGRAMVALIDQIREGKIKRDDTVILYHSGGLPGIFGYSEELSGLKSAKKEGII